MLYNFEQKQSWKMIEKAPGGALPYYIVGFHMTSLKFKLKKLSILPRFYFHDALEH